MTSYARVKLSSPDMKLLDNVAKNVIDIAEKSGIKHTGIIYLPTKKMVVPTRKSPCGGGTETYERWQMRVHKRMVDIYANELVLKKVMQLEMPEKVYVEIELK
jgi:small subunit ribosomal protein S10